MTRRLSKIRIDLFVVWLYRRRVLEAWHKRDPLDVNGPFGDNQDPWSAVLSWIARHTGFDHDVVDQYMTAITRQPRKKVDPYVSRELFKWWEDGNGDNLIRAFWATYPEVAETIQYLPRPQELVGGKEASYKTVATKPKKEAGKKQVKRKKRAKQPPRTELSERESAVKTALGVGLSKTAIARQLGITPGRVSQLIKQIERIEANATSRSTSMGAALPLVGDFSSDAPPNKRTHRQRKQDDQKL